MFTAAIAWMFSTKLGRTVTLAGAIVVAVLLSWWAFSSHYEKVGYDKCQGEHAAALAEANRKQAAQNAANDAISAGIGQKAAKDADKVVAAVDKQTTKTKENTDRVYSKPPTTAPVALGSCVHPLDDSVQDDIDRAVDRANATGSTLQATGGPYRTASAAKRSVDRVEAFNRGYERGYGQVEQGRGGLDSRRAGGLGQAARAPSDRAQVPGRS